MLTHIWKLYTWTSRKWKASKIQDFVLKNIIYLFIYACILLNRFLEAILIHLLNIFNTLHVKILLNTYYAASAMDSPETNKQIIANN